MVELRKAFRWTIFIGCSVIGLMILYGCKFSQVKQLPIAYKKSHIGDCLPNMYLHGDNSSIVAKVAHRNHTSLIAICVIMPSSTTSRIQKFVVPSLEKTISSTNRLSHDVRLYVAVHQADNYWVRKDTNLLVPDWLTVHLHVYKETEYAWDGIMRHAYNDGAHYLIRINDGTEFLTPDWVSMGVSALQNLNPPNVGVVSPTCCDENYHSTLPVMVHRTHFDIFHRYSQATAGPLTQIKGDLVLKAYEPNNVRKLSLWMVKEHYANRDARDQTSTGNKDSEHTHDEVAKAKNKLEDWLGFVDNRTSKSNVVAFSLYGNRSVDVNGAIMNAEAMNSVYPGWQMRIYYDKTVPLSTLEMLSKYSFMTFIDMTHTGLCNGMSWRFLVAADQGIQYYAVRDIDSCVTAREKAAVDEWITSGKTFHIMRDHPLHTTTILGGMWGGKGGSVPDMMCLLQKGNLGPHKHVDQQFLHKTLWPRVSKDVFQHDSHLCKSYPDTHPWPIKRKSDGDFVGRVVDLDINRLYIPDPCT